MVATILDAPIALGIVIYGDATAATAAVPLKISVQSSSSVNVLVHDIKDFCSSEAIEEIDDINNVVISSGIGMLLHHPDPSHLEAGVGNKKVDECYLSNEDIIIIFTNADVYNNVMAPMEWSLPLVPPDEDIRGKFCVKQKEDGNGIPYIEAFPDEENGDALFCDGNVFPVIDLTFKQLSGSNYNFIQFRDDHGRVKEKDLKGDEGKMLIYFIKSIHYNKNVDNRKPYGARTMTIRGFYYKFLELFAKSGYSEKLHRLLVMLSEGLRIKVGDKWVSIPERAFGVRSEPKAQYFGELSFKYYKDNQYTGQLDCNDQGILLNFGTGFPVPEYYPEAMLAMPIKRIDLDKVVITTNAKCILICEDGPTFNLLREAEVWKIFPLILVCAHGYPTNNAVAFVHMLQEALDVPAYGICDMNTGGVVVLHKFGSGTEKGLTTAKQQWSERDMFKTKVRWLALRPSQLDKLKPAKRSLKHTLRSAVFRIVKNVFGDNRLSRLDNHINGATSWIEDGGDRQEKRRDEMIALKNLGYGIDIETVDDDDVIKEIASNLLKVWLGLDNDDDNLAYV